MPPCSEYQKLMDEILDARCSPEEKTRYMEHISSCETCRTQYKEASALIRFLSNMEEVDPPSTLHDTIMARVKSGEKPARKLLPFRGALSLTASAAVLALFFFSGGYDALMPLLDSGTLTQNFSPAPMELPMAPAASPAETREFHAATFSLEDATSGALEESIVDKDGKSQNASAPCNAIPSSFSTPESDLLLAIVPSLSAKTFSTFDTALDLETPGFTVYLYANGFLSAQEILQKVGEPVDIAAQHYIIPSALIDPLLALCHSYDLVMQTEIADESIPYGVLIVVDPKV